MSIENAVIETNGLSLVYGPPLSEEPGLNLDALTMPRFLREVTTQFANREVLVTPEGERWSYAELWDRSFQVARALMAVGVGKGTRVGVMMTNRAEFLSATFGVALAGGVATTLSTFSTPSELEHLLKMSGISVLLFEQTVLAKDFSKILIDLEPALLAAKPGALQSTEYPFLRTVAMIGERPAEGAIEQWDDFLKRGEATAPAMVEAAAASVTPADVGVLFFSSGSTSKPKGILSAHRGVAIQLWRWRWIMGLIDDVRTWSANGFFWSGNFGMAIGGTLSMGGSLVLQPTFNADQAIELMAREKVTFPLAWPHQWAQLTAAANYESADLSALHYVGGANPLVHHPTVNAKWREPHSVYGNTETFTAHTAFSANVSVEDVAGGHGRPLAGNALKIVDAMTGQTLPVGQRGEIAVKGATLMLGYLGVPLDETVDSEGFFHTGDGGYVDNTGRLYWEGRLNDIIKTGGANVSPLEIDAVIAAIPGVKVTQTVGIPHETLGELVVACIVPHEGAALNEQAIRDQVKEKLASYKVPRRVLFFTSDELALTSTNKVKTADLRKIAAERMETAGA